MKRRISLSISLRNSAVLSALAGTLSANAWADPPAKPGAAPAVAPAAKPAAPAAKAAEPAVKPAAPVAKAAEPAAKPAAPAAKAAEAAAKPAAKPHPKAAVAPPKLAVVAQPAPAPEPGTSKEEVAALRAEAKAMREDLQALRSDLNHAVGATTVSANQERAQLETELGEARKKRAAIQAAVDAGLDRAAVADSITSSDARIAQLEAALAQKADAPSGRSLAEVSADVRRLDAAVAKREASAPAAATTAATPAKGAPDPAPSELTVSKTGFFQPSATLQVWALASHLANDATPKESWTNTLRIRRAELKIKGEIIRKTFGYSVMFDPARLLDFSNKTIPVTGEAPAPTTAGSVSVAQPQAGGSTSILQDVALSYLSDYADVSFGQFKIPVSLEGSGSAGKLYFPERALISRKYGDRRDIGVKAEKKFDKFGYTLGLYNGEGQNKLDSNDQKDLTLRLEAYPIKELTLAVVGYSGLTERTEVGTKDRVEGDVKLEKSNFLLQAEYIRGWDMTGTPAAHKRMQGQGFYVMAGYTWFDKLQPVVRVGSLDPEIGHDEGAASALDPNDETTSYELGANYYFKGHDAKLQLSGGIFDPEQRSQHTRFDLTLAAQLAF